jgi:signal transduction histidine kinase
VDSPSPPPGAAAPADTLRKLQAVTDAALAHLSLDDLLDELLTRVRDALEADTCAVLLLEETGKELVARAAKGLEEEVEQGVRIPVGLGFAGRVVKERRAVVIPDVEHSEVVNPILREKGLKSMLGVPLIAHGDVLGVIHVGTLYPRDFTPFDIELLGVVADRVALGVERALIYDELVRLTQVQRDFVALAAHELRTPATTVFGLVATLQGRTDLPEEQVVELQETLFHQADRLRRLVEQLLDLSRLDSAAARLAPERIKLRPQLEEIVDAAGLTRGEITVDVPADLEVTVDAATIDRVVGNLLANAVNHGQPPVVLTAEQRDRHLRIAVQDEGEGVSAEFVPFLFDRFRRSEETREASSVGSGLGLAIARAYARAHGGDIIYSPAAPSGARFELVLPVAG